MSVLSGRASAAPDTTAWAVLSVLGLAVAGGVTAFGGVLAVTVIASALGVTGTDAYAVVGRASVRVGFAVVAVAFLAVAGDRSQ
jgi:hypothetical protein